MLRLNFSEDLSAASGGLILIIVLLIITAVVFAIKFALDIALNKKLTYSYEKDEPKQSQSYRENNYLYAIKNDTPKRQTRTRTTKKPQYTIIPENKLFILEKPSAKDKY